jgi:hypothetical protein
MVAYLRGVERVASPNWLPICGGGGGERVASPKWLPIFVTAKAVTRHNSP